jgi:hypothetical protein
MKFESKNACPCCRTELYPLELVKTDYPETDEDEDDYETDEDDETDDDETDDDETDDENNNSDNMIIPDEGMPHADLYRIKRAVIDSGISQDDMLVLLTGRTDKDGVIYSKSVVSALEDKFYGLMDNEDMVCFSENTENIHMGEEDIRTIKIVNRETIQAATALLELCV